MTMLHGRQQGAQQGAGAELLARIQSVVEQTPYRLDTTEDGFEVTVDVPERNWHGLFHAKCVQQVFSHRVQVDERARKLSITDRVSTLTWERGADGPVPRVGATKSVGSGRAKHVSFQKTLGGESSNDFSFSSEEGRKMITEPAKQLGWQIAWGRNAVIGLIVGGTGAGVASIALIVLGILVLAGTF